jgi:hypothetical protein
MATKVEVLEIKEVRPQIMTVHIVGDSDLVLNKMNDVSTREMVAKRINKAKEITNTNVWEEIITAIHWRDGKPSEFTEESMAEALTNNAPCFTAFGAKKSFGEAVVRLGIDNYSTKFDASVNIIAPGGLIPIKFSEHFVDEKLMSPVKGSPVLVHLNRFVGWSADIQISYIDSVYSAEQLLNVINLAGFGIGIGSGRRSCGYGRYHVEGIR